MRIIGNPYNFIVSNYQQQKLKIQKNNLLDMQSLTHMLTLSAIISAANPLQTVKSRIQTMNQLIDRGTINQKYHGIIDCAKSIKINQGIKGLWKGNSISLARFFPNQKINNDVKNYFKSLLSSQNVGSNIGAGVIGGWTAAAIMYPIDTVRIFISTSTRKSSHTVLQIIKKLRIEGGKFLFKGYSSSLLNIALFRGTYFGMFDSLKQKTFTQTQKWIAAYISGFTAGLIVYPVETLRKKKILCKRNSSYCSILQKTAKNEGLKGFFRGCSLTPLQSLVGAVVLMYFDSRKNSL